MILCDKGDLILRLLHDVCIFDEPRSDLTDLRDQLQRCSFFFEDCLCAATVRQEVLGLYRANAGDKRERYLVREFVVHENLHKTTKEELCVQELLIRLYILLYGAAHGECFRRWCHHIHFQLGIFHSFRGGGSECSNAGCILLEKREVLEEGFDV